MADAITGNFAQVTAALGAVVVRVEAAGEAVTSAGADIVALAAAQRAPRFTGHLATSTTDDGSRVVVDTPYAGYQEYGTRHHAAQPFLRPAIEATEPAVRAAAERIYTVATR